MTDSRKELQSLRRAAKDAGWTGDYDRALALYEAGLEVARERKNRDLEDLFTCNRASVLLEMDRQDFDFSELKRIILREPKSPNSFLASYSTARTLESRGMYSRASFYATIALAKSRQLESEEWISSSLNLLATMESRESRFESALGLYSEALERLRAKGLAQTGLAGPISDNLGYCHIAMGRTDVGIPFVRRAISLLEDLGAQQATDYPCLDLCFAELKRKRLDEAWNWGLRALDLGVRFRRRDVLKNSHYLLAETCSRMGDHSLAEKHYEALASFYPDFPALRDYLREITVLDLLNLT